MAIYYITGNKEKFRETKMIIPEIKQLEIDLPEIQEIDPEKIIKAKIEAAKEHKQGRIFIDDASLYLEAMNGLPGPLIKWFLKTIGNDGLYKIAKCFGNFEAKARLVIGYSDGNNEIHYFAGEVKGKIVEPRGETRFGWDPIFQPDGYEKTYAEMTIEEKNEMSHRRMALNKLKEYLKNEL